MERISDRLALWVLRSIAVALLFFGASMLMAGAPAVSILTESAVGRSIAWIFVQIAIGFIIAGTAAIYLSRLHGPLLPNERLATSDTSRAPLGGWVMAFAVTFVVLPVWLVYRLQPLFDGWAVVIDYLSTWDWSGANAAGSGLVLLPVAAALTPPAFQLCAALFLTATSVMLFVLLLLRSSRFPRIYGVCLVLSAALVFAGVRSAAAAVLAGDAALQIIQDTAASADESAQLTEGLQRYTGIVGSTAPVLLWTWFGYLVWLSPLLFSRRATSTFARRSAARIVTPATAADLEAITSPPA
jgi:hypothetical protein